METRVTLGHPGVDTLMQDMSIQDIISAQDTLGQKSQPALLELGQSYKESGDVGCYLVVPLTQRVLGQVTSLWA